MTSRTRFALACALAVAVAVPAAAAAAPALIQVAPLAGSEAPAFGFVRAPSGSLYVVFPRYTGNFVPDGLYSASFYKTGAKGPFVTALTGWQVGLPGLFALPNGTLEAVFGAISPDNAPSVWGVTSANGGATWSAPTDVRSGPNEPLAYGSDLSGVVAGGTPVLTLPQAGNLVVQTGLGGLMPTFQVNDASDGALGNVESAVDGSGVAVASWQSLNGNGLFMQQVAPTVGTAQLVPGQLRTSLSLAGRDNGAGVYAPYTLDGTTVRLMRYGGGSVEVGSLAGVSAKVMGVATGPSGRIWVMWGDEDHGIAVTRSNKAVTQFEPIQTVPDPNTATLWRLAGDGRLGPLELLVHATRTNGTHVLPQLDHAHLWPRLSAKTLLHPVKNGNGQVIAYKLKVFVTDAGDAIAGASATWKGKTATTNSLGVATIVVSGSSAGGGVDVTDPGYAPLTIASV